MADILRAPLVTPPVRRRAPMAVAVAANLLLTTLTAVPVSPVRASIPERIVTRPSPHVSLLPVAYARFGLSALALTPFVPEPDVLPLRTRQVQGPSIAPSLLTTTLASAAVQAPFAQRDWVNPTTRRAPLQIRQSIIFEVVEEIVPVPFAQGDWQNPIRRPYRQPVEARPTFDRTVPVTEQTEWPNPVRRIAPREWGVSQGVNWLSALDPRGSGVLMSGGASITGAGTVTGVGTPNRRKHKIYLDYEPILHRQ